MRSSLLLIVVPALSLAQVNECAEGFSECKEDCALEFSSVRPEVQKKLGKCLKKCAKKQTACEERELETRTNNLDQGALERAPASTDVDENGMPNRTTGRSDEGSGRRAPADDLRDDRGAPAEPTAPARKATPEPNKPPRAEVSEQELPKSSRTQLKTDEKEPAPVTEKPARRDPEPVVMTPKPDTRKKLDEDVRDDGPRREESVARREEAPAPKKAEKKKDDLPPPPPKPKEEDHDDLRNY
ncbi:MAG: hypothetical protein SFW67_14135 [Myxococcaceae bacterium]|nr:hypothetical protein [Myxococcaceae bacterium]